MGWGGAGGVNLQSLYMTNSNELIIVKARIYFRTTAEGGRATGIISGYRPNHVFERPVDIRGIHAYIGEVQFEDQEFIQPGETKIVTVRFLRVPAIEKFIKVGQKWLIYEVPKLVAEGEIIGI
jgi:translation elongation factor EF-Tu-like GTPase